MATEEQKQRIYQAYFTGRMDPEDAKQYAAGVHSGAIQLPPGGKLKADDAVWLPQSVTEAYTGGRMSEEDRTALEAAMQAGKVRLPPAAVDLIPQDDPNWQPPTEQGVIQRPVEKPAPTIGERLKGAGEAALAAGTGMIGQVVGTVQGIAESPPVLGDVAASQAAAQKAEEIAAQKAAEYTYQPRGETGQAYTQTLGEVGQQLQPLMGLTGEMAAMAPLKRAAPTNAAKVEAAARVETTTAAETAAKTEAAAAISRAQKARAAAEAVKKSRAAAAEKAKAVADAKAAAKAAEEARAKVEEATRAKAAAEAEAGAIGIETPLSEAEAQAAAARREKAAALPTPVQLTKGAETRSAAQLSFEKEQMKSPSLGAPLRTRAEENNLQILSNFDKVIDASGAKTPDLVATGNAVTKALSEGYKAAKNKTNVAYAKARKSPESKAAVDPGAVVTLGEGEEALQESLTSYLNKKISGTPSASVPDTARRLMVKMDLATQDEKGNLIAKPATVGKMEDLRRELSGIAKTDDRVGLREETILKKIIDAQTEPVAGPLYKEARATRMAQARKYENRAVVARLLQTVKGGEDARVMSDKVFDRSIMTSSPEEIVFLKRVLQTSGDPGKQAWKELQGALIRHIKEKSTSVVSTDSGDAPIVSPAKLHQAVTALDKNKRLEIVLGKKNANIIRDLNDVAKYVSTVPPGTLVNSSNTAATIIAAMAEAGTLGATTGIPVPVLSALRALSNTIKSSRIKAKINKALNSGAAK